MNLLQPRCCATSCFSFQLAYTAEEGWLPNAARIRLKVESDLAPWITVYRVGHIASTLPTYPRVDDDYERSAPGLYPDRLDRLQEHIRGETAPEPLAVALGPGGKSGRTAAWPAHDHVHLA
jgi:hypothetical protein